MLNHKFLLIIGILFLSSSCFNYETQYEGPYNDGDNTLGTFPKELVYVAGGNVFLADEFAENTITLDNSGSTPVASINNNHSKVLYKREGGKIQIYDIETETVVDEVPNSENADWFDFHPNNETIYFLTNNNLDTYGPEVLPARPLDLKSLIGLSAGEVYGVVIDANDLIYFSFVSTGTNTKYLYKSDGVNILITKTINEVRSDFRLSPDNSDIWMTVNQGSEDVFIVSTSSLNSLFSLSDTRYGAPTTGTQGYTILVTNEIRTPYQNNILVSVGFLTSIDH